MTSLIWKWPFYPPLFFTKIVSKSHYSHYHGLWKINTIRTYTILNLSWKRQKIQKIRYTSESLTWKWRNNPLPELTTYDIISLFYWFSKEHGHENSVISTRFLWRKEEDRRLFRDCQIKHALVQAVPIVDSHKYKYNIW